MVSKQKFKALVVDDNVQFRNVLMETLRREDIAVEEASDGVVAENILRRQNFDLVTVDLIMPRKHGHKLVQEVLDQEQRPIIVVLTGVNDKRIARDLLARGVDDIYFKPFDITLFAIKVKILMERRRGAQDSIGTASADMPQQIARTTALLESQLESIQSSFRETIASLEKQKEDLEIGLVGSVRFLTSIINQVGKFEGSHAVRVEKLAGAIAGAMGLSKTMLKDINIAALLHDIGQFGMPEKVRNSPPWRLLAEERDIYETYPTIGALLLSEIQGIEDVVPMVEHHTEHFDGSGFPAGLVGDGIPLGARILAVADGYETAVHFEKEGSAIEDLARQKGKRYDPAIVNLAINHLRALAAESHTARPMESIRVAELSVDHMLADPILDDRGIMLVGSERKLTMQALDKVKKLVPDQVVSVYLDDPEEESEIDDAQQPPSA